MGGAGTYARKSQGSGDRVYFRQVGYGKEKMLSHMAHYRVSELLCH